MAVSDAPAPGATADDVAEWVRLGREALRARRYKEARDLFDRALATRPDDPRVQGLAVTAEFWRRLARDGDGFAPEGPEGEGEDGGGGRRGSAGHGAS